MLFQVAWRKKEKEYGGFTIAISIKESVISRVYAKEIRPKPGVWAILEPTGGLDVFSTIVSRAPPS